MKYKRNIENKKCEQTGAENRHTLLAGKRVSSSKIPDKEMSHIQMKHKYDRVAAEAQQ